MKIKLTFLTLIITGSVFAQDLGQVYKRIFERSITPNAQRNAQLVAIWDAIDSAKTNTTLTKLIITRIGTNCTINAVEVVDVKVIEN